MPYPTLGLETPTDACDARGEENEEGSDGCDGEEGGPYVAEHSLKRRGSV